MLEFNLMDDDDTQRFIDPEEACTCDIKVLLWRGHEKNCPYLEYLEAIKVFEDWDSIIEAQEDEGVVEEFDPTTKDPVVGDGWYDVWLP